MFISWCHLEQSTRITSKRKINRIYRGGGYCAVSVPLMWNDPEKWLVGLPFLNIYIVSVFAFLCLWHPCLYWKQWNQSLSMDNVLCVASCILDHVYRKKVLWKHFWCWTKKQKLNIRFAVELRWSLYASALSFRQFQENTSVIGCLNPHNEKLWWCLKMNPDCMRL